ncbi:MAG: AraC family transcriptional regulator [Lachnospiraceae bacterium]|nr:AraC family transcriptional regulator [Lachnospiraceae bacterium]
MEKYFEAIGPIPPEDTVCVNLYEEGEQILLESYAYEVGYFRFNWHPSLEILIVLQGSLKAYTEHGVFELQEDEFVVIPPNEGHASLLQTPHTVALVLHISAQYLEKLCGGRSLSTMHGSSHDIKEDAVRSLILGSAAAIYLALSTKQRYSELFARAQAELLFSVLLKNYALHEPTARGKRADPEQKKKVHILLQYINRHFRERISLDDLAEAAQMNRSYVSTYFREHTGINYHEYLTRRRLVYAAYMLHNTDVPILEVALDAGFPDVKALHQAFRKYFRLSPGEYRRGLNSDCDESVRNLFPNRLPFADALVQRKLTGYTRRRFAWGEILE